MRSRWHEYDGLAVVVLCPFLGFLRWCRCYCLENSGTTRKMLLETGELVTPEHQALRSLSLARFHSTTSPRHHVLDTTSWTPSIEHRLLNTIYWTPSLWSISCEFRAIPPHHPVGPSPEHHIQEPAIGSHLIQSIEKSKVLGPEARVLERCSLHAGFHVPTEVWRSCMPWCLRITLSLYTG